MPSTTNLPKKKRYIWNTVGNIFVIFWLSIFSLIILVIILIQTAPVQNYARIKIQNYLQKKLNTRVEIGKLKINFLNSVSLADVYIEDQTKDTLLSGGQLKVNLDMWLLLKKKVQISNIDLEDVTVKLKRSGTDSFFNFQFIVNAFAGKSSSGSTDTSGFKMTIDNMTMNRSRVVYRDTISGDDMDIYLKHFDTKISKFDLDHMYFDVPAITLTGLRGYYYQNEPLKRKIVEAVAKAVQKPNTYLEFKNALISLTDIDFDYKSVPTNIATAVKIGTFEAHPDTINIRDGKFTLKDLTMDKSTIEVTMSDTKAPAITIKEQQAINSLPSFTLKSNKLKITASNFKLDDISMPVEKYGMDYGHLDIRDINIDAGPLFHTFQLALIYRPA